MNKKNRFKKRKEKKPLREGGLHEHRSAQGDGKGVGVGIGVIFLDECAANRPRRLYECCLCDIRSTRSFNTVHAMFNTVHAMFNTVHAMFNTVHALCDTFTRRTCMSEHTLSTSYS